MYLYCKKVNTEVLVSKEVLFGLWKDAPLVGFLSQMLTRLISRYVRFCYKFTRLFELLAVFSFEYE